MNVRSMKKNSVLAVIRVAAGTGIADGKQVKSAYFDA